MCFAAYFGYYLVTYSNNKYELYTVLDTTVDDDVALSGFFIRDEQVVTYDGTGTAVLEADEGKKVKKDGVVAKIYSDSAALEQQAQIKRLQKNIDALNSAVDGVNLGTDSLSNIESSIADIYTRIAGYSIDGDTSKVYSLEQDLNKLLCRRYMLLADDAQKTEVTTLLEQQIAKEKQLGKSSYKTIIAPEAGYFVTTVDGLENTLTVEGIDTLTCDYLEGLDDYSYQKPDNCIGKLITDFRWHYAAIATDKQIKNIAVGQQVIMRFPFAMDISVKATVEKIITESTDKNIIVVNSDYMIDNLNYLREQTATLVKTQVSGLKVDSKAVRVIDGVTGVFAIRGSIAKFIPIDIVYSTDNYYLVKWDQTSKSSLMVSETVIVGGKDIYDGKQITG